MSQQGEPENVVLSWEAAVELSYTLLFYVRAWEDQQSGAGVSVPADTLLRDGGALAASTIKRWLPTPPMNAAMRLWETRHFGDEA